MPPLRRIARWPTFVRIRQTCIARPSGCSGSAGRSARVLKLQPEQVRVRYVESSGTFGHSGYDDVATAAAILSQAVGKPVRVQFSRGDEHGWDNFGPAHLADVRAAANADGRLVGFEYHGWQHGWNFVVEPSEELALDAKIPDPVTPPAVGDQQSDRWRRVQHSEPAGHQPHHERA